MKPPVRLLFVVNDAAFFLSHRLPIALAARDQGYEVHVATGTATSHIPILEAGIHHHALRLSRSGLNPFLEIRLFVEILRIMRSLRPSIVHLVTIKPVLYGGVAARLIKIPGIVAAVSGLGFAFSSSGFKARVVRILATHIYRLALGADRTRVIFQNESDRNTLIRAEAVTREQSILIPGSGVDLHQYHPLDQECSPPIVLMAGRLLWAKGIREFVEAARALKSAQNPARFVLVGGVDPANPESVTEKQLIEWQKQGLIEWWGHRNDMPQVLGNASIVSLPSYYGEGMPKVLLEAAACGKPVVTTDWPGCRDAVEDNKTGLLVPVRNSNALATAILDLLENPDKRARFGVAARQRAQSSYSIESVIESHLSIYRNFCAR